ncbi:MAG: hypothetical protein RML35_00855 [Chloroherpetonaceae bacterium]|nr:hypothetical protein [Chloroherpetonaceae bacterium]
MDEVWLSLNGPVDRFQSSILHLSPAISTVQYDNPEPGIQRIKFSFSYYQGGSAKQVGSISNPHYVWVRFGIPQGYNVSVSKIELPITQG